MKYKYISQKPYCCVPACVQMILYQRKLSIPTQQDIAYDLGIILPLKDRYLLPKSYKGRRPKAGWGTRINVKKYSLAEFFKRRKYFLQETYYPIKKFCPKEQFKKFLSDNIKKGNDLLICFNYPLLYNLKGSWGHASLIEEIRKEYVVLRDPSLKHRNARKVLLDDLLFALKNHYYGGIWVISNKK